MFFVIIINILIMIWLYIKYINIPKINTDNIQEIEELESALIGYIYDEDGNSIDWILAEILELNRKGYIEIEYLRKDIEEYEYIMRKKDNIEISQLKEYELTAYRFLFSEKNEITMSELEKKILRSLQAEIDVGVKSINIKNEIEEELIKLNIISYPAKKTLNAFVKVYAIAILMMVIFIKNIERYQLIIIFIESILIFCMFYKATFFTKQGKSLHSKIKQYRNNLKYNEILKEKKIMHNILFEKAYSDSIALHIMSKAREEFINDEIVEKKLRKLVKYMPKIIYIALYIIMYSVSILFY